MKSKCIVLCSAIQLCPTVCDPMDCSPPGSSVQGIIPEGILEWGAISYSRGSSWLRDQICISCIGRRNLYHWNAWEAINVLEDLYFH